MGQDNEIVKLAFDEKRGALYAATNHFNDEGEIVRAQVDKFDPAGNVLWTYSPNGAAGALRILRISDISTASHVYLASYDAEDQVSLIKITRDGQEVWSAAVTAGSDASVATYWPTHEIFVLLSSIDQPMDGQDPIGSSDMVLVKMSKGDGSKVWTKRYGSTGYNTASALAVDPHRHVVYIAGDTDGDIGDQTNHGGFDGALLAVGAHTG